MPGTPFTFVGLVQVATKRTPPAAHGWWYREAFSIWRGIS